MTFAISIDSAAWRQHTAAVRDRVHGAEAALIPVVKANGYGLGQALLAEESARLGLRAIAVGTVFEVDSVATGFAGDIIVMEPIDPRDPIAAAKWAALAAAETGPRLIATVANSRGLDHVLDTFAHPRVLLEGMTSMRRFGFDGPRLRDAWQYASQAVAEGRLRLHGLSVHLPMQPRNEDFDEILQLVDEIGDDSAHVLLSHVDVAQLEILRRHNPQLRFSLRIGTTLWLGDRGFLTAEGTVLAVHRVNRGQSFGYHHRRTGSNGAIVVVSGGTSHGIALHAPSQALTLRQRVVAAGLGLLNAGGRVKSPFMLGKVPLWFAEPPHQLVSMLWLPSHTEPPAVGSTLPANVRYTITHADDVRVS